MKKLLAAAFVCVAAAAPVHADLYNDSAGDTFPGVGGGGILDILSVEVTNDATDLYFTFTLGADVEATDWGKYLVIFDTTPGGDPAGNGWARPISMPDGADYWIGSWVDSGNGAELYNYTGTWNRIEATYDPVPNNDITISKSGSTVTISTPFSNLGLGIGDKFWFDAFSSGGGGGDGAIDSLGNPNQQVADWGEASDAHPLSYTLIPEPATLGLLALAVVAMTRRRR